MQSSKFSLFELTTYVHTGDNGLCWNTRSERRHRQWRRQWNNAGRFGRTVVAGQRVASDAGRFFNGRSANISKVGVFITVPMTTPIRRGSVVELNFPRTDELAEKKGQFARIKRGRVVRVDRQGTLKDAVIGLGIAFE